MSGLIGLGSMYWAPEVRRKFVYLLLPLFKIQGRAF
jgi:hypothetical protein